MERMVQVFGADECWWVEDWGWKNPKALSFYHSVFKDIAKGGAASVSARSRMNYTGEGFHQAIWRNTMQITSLAGTIPIQGNTLRPGRRGNWEEKW